MLAKLENFVQLDVKFTEVDIEYLDDNADLTRIEEIDGPEYVFMYIDDPSMLATFLQEMKSAGCSKGLAAALKKGAKMGAHHVLLLSK